MLLRNAYWYFQSALDNTFCDQVIEHANSKKDTIAVTGKFGKKKKLSKEDKNNLKKQRNSNIVWLNDKWIYDRITPFIHIANENAGWNFETDWCESIQFTKYKLNQFYDWHCDPMDVPYKSSDPNFNGKIRKLSATVQLSSSDDYKGGDFELQPRMRTTANYKINVKEIKPRGSVLVFPSHLWHRVKPVTKGVRYSLVLWNLGYPFK
tara:strand:- start:2096 stop:2716 length:621 start_codon:yes stop_codon:yes gene_type:complete